MEAARIPRRLIRMSGWTFGWNVEFRFPPMRCFTFWMLLPATSCGPAVIRSRRGTIGAELQWLTERSTSIHTTERSTVSVSRDDSVGEPDPAFVVQRLVRTGGKLVANRHGAGTRVKRLPPTFARLGRA